MPLDPKRARGTSHKKKQTLVATIKKENAVIAKKARLAKHPTSSLLPSTNQAIIDVHDEYTNQCTITPAAVVTINSPLSRRKKLVIITR